MTIGKNISPNIDSLEEFGPILPIQKVANFLKNISETPLLSDIRKLHSMLKNQKQIIEDIEIELQKQNTSINMKKYIGQLELYVGEKKDKSRKNYIKNTSSIIFPIALKISKEKEVIIHRIRNMVRKSLVKLFTIVGAYQKKREGENPTMNSISYELGLCSCGYFGKHKNYLVPSLLSMYNEKDLEDLNICFSISKYKRLPDSEIYLKAQEELKIILGSVCELLEVSCVGNSDISKLLDIRSYSYSGDQKRETNWFSFSLLGILKRMGIVSRFEKDKRYYLLEENYRELIVCQPRIQKRNRGMSHAAAYIESFLIYLKNEKIIYGWKREHTFSGCKKKRCLRFDWIIWINDKNGKKRHYLIEYDGGQHFKMNKKFGQQSFDSTQENDKIKNEYCINNKIYLLRIGYTESYPEIKIDIEGFIERIGNGELPNEYVIKKGKCYYDN